MPLRRARGVFAVGMVTATPHRTVGPNSPASQSASRERNDSSPRPVHIEHRTIRLGLDGSVLTGRARPASAYRSLALMRMVVHPAPP